MSKFRMMLVSILLALVLSTACAGGERVPGATAPPEGQLVALDDFPAGVGRGFARAWVDPAAKPPPFVQKGDRAPNFAFVLDDGNYATLDDLKGRPVLINFWATWCGPCRLEMPELVKAAQENEDLVVLAVNMQEARSAVEPFAQEFDMTMPIVLDADGRLRMQYLVRGLPTTYFVDRESKIASVVAGPLTPKILADRLAEIR